MDKFSKNSFKIYKADGMIFTIDGTPLRISPASTSSSLPSEIPILENQNAA
jgi:hypothetical protein